MIDFHSHVLPGIDDGSQSVEESLLLLDSLGVQGIKTVVATPHFYANSFTVDSFVQKRGEAYDDIKAKLESAQQKVLLGAEVLFYDGISRLGGIKKLCIENSKLLLLEMPFAKWTDYTLGELFDMSRSGSYRVVLAHIERYYDLQSKAVWQQLAASDVLFQVNASFFLSFRTRRKAIKLLQNGYVHFLGSDCHNMTSRPPKIGEAYGLLAKKLGIDTVSQMIEFGYSFLK